MKRILISMMVLSCVFVSCKPDAVQTPVDDCKCKEAPDADAFLGSVSFIDQNKTWKIIHRDSGTPTVQIWSSAVKASNCDQKETFNGGDWQTLVYNADCRSSLNEDNDNKDHGTLFSWCAVNKYKDKLCPDGWNVPTYEDFVELDSNLMKYGVSKQKAYTDADIWGGTYGGLTNSVGRLEGQGSAAYYWSLTQSVAPDLARRLYFNTSATNIKDESNKNSGFLVRCVKYDFGANRVTGISLYKDTLLMISGRRVQLLHTITPSDAAVTKVTWASGNTAVATVNNGQVAVGSNKQGSTTVTVTTQDGNKRAGCIVIAYQPANKVTLNETEVSLAEKETFGLTAEVIGNPVIGEENYTPTRKYVTWSSDNSAVATVDNSGKITAVSEGSATITVTTNDTVRIEKDTTFGSTPKTATCMVTVYAVAANGCNKKSFDIGTPKFANDNKEWAIGTQTWSDVVTTDKCNKATFDGGLSNNYNADCRTHKVPVKVMTICREDTIKIADTTVVEGSRDSTFTVCRDSIADREVTLFSWCAINRFGDQLCTGDWRVPTKQDFVDLDVTMGGAGSFDRIDAEFVNNHYRNEWSDTNNVVYGGYCSPSNASQTSGAYYWADTQSSATDGYTLYFTSDGNINPQYQANRGNGFRLRCIKN